MADAARGSAGRAARIVGIAAVAHGKTEFRRDAPRPQLGAEHCGRPWAALAVAKAGGEVAHRPPTVLTEFVELVLPDEEVRSLEPLDPLLRREDRLLGEQLTVTGRHRQEQAAAD